MRFDPKLNNGSWKKEGSPSRSVRSSGGRPAAARASLPPSLDKWLEKLRPPTLMSSTIELMTILYQGRGRREAGCLAARGHIWGKTQRKRRRYLDGGREVPPIFSDCNHDQLLQSWT